jgi:hypothetical protein
MRRPAAVLLWIMIGFFLRADSTPYAFPVKPGTLEWAALSPEESKALCQIPPEIMRTLDTDALVETCMSYPFISDYLLFSDQRAALKHVISGFNGFQELSQRKDAARKLLDWYRRNTDDFSDTSNPPYAAFSFLHSYLGLPEVISMFNTSEKAQLALQSLRFVRAARLRNGTESVAEAMGALLFTHLIARERVELTTAHGHFDANSLPTELAAAEHADWNPPRELCDVVQSIAQLVLP